MKSRNRCTKYIFSVGPVRGRDVDDWLQGEPELKKDAS